jgi:hypothetical protein
LQLTFRLSGFHVVHLARGPEDLEYHYYEHLVMDDILGLIRRAERRVSRDGSIMLL